MYKVFFTTPGAPRSRNLFAGLFFILLGVSACKKTPATIDGPNATQFNYLDTKFKLNYENGPERLNGKVKLRLKRDSLIWASITGPLGAEGIRAKVLRDSIFMIDRISKTYVESGLDTLDQILNFEVDFDMLQSMILGNMPFPTLSKDEEVMDGKFKKIIQDRGNIILQNFINPKSQKLEKLFINDKRNKNTLEVNFKDFKKFPGLTFPTRSTIQVRYFNRNTNTMEEANVNVNHSKTYIPDGVLSFPFNVPRNYEKVVGRN